jgi:hypothetical protein
LRAGCLARHDHGQTTLTADGRVDDVLGHLAGEVRAGQDDRRLPDLAARVAGPQHERGLLRPTRRAEQRRRQFEGLVEVGDVVGMRVIEEGRFPDAGADQVGHLGEQGAGESGGDAADHRVGLIDGSDHGQQTERLEIDEHVATVGVHADLGERHARSAHRSGRLGEELDRHETRKRPARPLANPRGREVRGRGEGQLDVTVRADTDDRYLRRAVRQRGGGRPHGDVDALQSLTRIDAPQEPFGGNQLGRWLGHAGPRFGRPQPDPAAGSEEGEHPGGEHRRLSDADWRRRSSRRNVVSRRAAGAGKRWRSGCRGGRGGRGRRCRDRGRRLVRPGDGSVALRLRRRLPA